MPYKVKNPETKDEIPVPCGKCPVCAARRASQWSFRLMAQERVSTSAAFITLTYDTNSVPISRNGFMSLCSSDLQKFFKRLRKIHDGRRGAIKYYAVGEYGSQTHRPHYHAIVFNLDVEQVETAWTLNGNPIGQIHVGNVSGASVGYTLKYIHKGRWSPWHRNDDREPPKSLMSKGLGLAHLTPEMVAWYKADMLNRTYCNIEDGKIIAMPRYFKQKLYSDEEREQICYHQQQFIKEKQIKEGEAAAKNPLYWQERDEAVRAAFLKQKLKNKNETV